MEYLVYMCLLLLLSISTSLSTISCFHTPLFVVILEYLILIPFLTLLFIVNEFDSLVGQKPNRAHDPNLMYWSRFKSHLSFIRFSYSETQQNETTQMNIYSDVYTEEKGDSSI